MAMFQYEFMQRAFIAGGAIAVLAPILGIFLILRKQSLMADTLAHISLAGVAFGYLISLDPTLSTILFVAIAAVLLEYLRKVYSDYSDISVAMLMSGGMALALLLLTKVNSSTGIESYLFGSIVTISSLQLWVLVILAVGLVLTYIIFKKPLYVLSFDEDTAYTAGLPTQMMSVIFSVITGVAISAIMIMPSAIAMRLMKNFDGVIIVATIVGLIGMWGGLVTSYFFDTPPGATITAIFIVIFILESIVLKIVK